MRYPSDRRGGHAWGQLLLGIVVAFAFACGHAGAAGLSPGAAEYSALLGGGADDQALAITHDNAGNTYITGRANSTDFPTTADALERTFQGRPVRRVPGQIRPEWKPPLLRPTSAGPGRTRDAASPSLRAGRSTSPGFTSSPDFPGQPAAGSSYGGGLDAVRHADRYGRVTRVVALPRWRRRRQGTRPRARRVRQRVPHRRGERGIRRRRRVPSRRRTAGDVDSFAAKVGPTGALVSRASSAGPTTTTGSPSRLDGSNNAYVTGKASPGFPSRPARTTSRRTAASTCT
jgi:hypothetical protein